MKKAHEILKEYRKSQGIKQKHIAKKTGKPISRISAIENGRIKLTADEFIDISINGYGKNPAFFFENTISSSEIDGHDAQ